MKKFKKFVTNNSLLIVIISILLIIPAYIGYKNTRVNYDILVYLPSDIETIKGENILTDEFGLGSYAFVIEKNMSNNNMLKLEDKIRNIDNVNVVISASDILDTIPYEMLPSEVSDKIYKDNYTIMMVTFDGGTSEDTTINAVRELRSVVGDANSVSSMTAMVVDTMDLSNKEVFIYVAIAVILCLIVLVITTESYIIPILLLANIGMAIIYNLGSNIFLGQISYITKAITAVLQLGVTTDFSIFLYHKYMQAKEKYSDNKLAMEEAIGETFTSVIGSSTTTFAGFLALCTMDLTLGKDIGIVMAKGVLFGLITVLTVFPALLLVFDKLITKTKHKKFFPEFKGIQSFCIKKYKYIMIVFVILCIPILIGNSRYDVYYKLDDSLPKDLPFSVANSSLADKFNIVSPEIIIIDKNIKSNNVDKMVEEIRNVDGINLVLAPSTLVSSDVVNLLPDDVKKVLDNDKYQLVVVNSTYEIATDEINNQISSIDNIVKKYDKNGIVAGEGPLMKDLVNISDHDFKMVNYTSILVIFIIMILVLKSISLPIILILLLEMAIFANMAFAYYIGDALPFIASIVVGTVQLGATIDYAILMSTKYLEERTMNKKKEALVNTLKVTVPSIITSALCFFAATFGVAVYTKIDMIGSICELLARGAIISMVAVIFVLPALFMIFDKFIIKFTKMEKESV